MLSIETETKLAEIFLTLAEGEKTIDINRQILIELEDFDPLKIFNYLDSNQKNYLNCADLLNYFTERGINTNEIEITLIILFYDRDYDGVLSYPEFTYFLQSDYSKKGLINNYHQDKNNLNDDINLSPSIEQALTQLFSNEVDLSKKIIGMLNDLKKRFDFNIHDLYHAVKNYNFIEENSLRNFFTRNKISFLESDIRQIMKRLDLNGDGKIDLCEFHAFLGFPDCQFCCPIEECNCCGICCCDSCLCDVPCFIHNCVHGKLNIQNKNENNIKELNEDNNSKIDNIKDLKIEENINDNHENISGQNIYENKLNKNNLNFLNYNKNKTNMENLNSNLQETKNYNFQYNKDLEEQEEPNPYIGHVSDNLILRLSPQRKYSPNHCDCNHFHSNQCIHCDYCCCDFHYQEPCPKCIHNHYNFSENEEEKTTKFSNSNYMNKRIEKCEACNQFPCNCCPNCKSFPCKCCPTCHLPECICCNICHKYPCKCCPKCHFNICKCCKVCHQYPCQCCPNCHMAQCICCENCESYPCKCCPDCHSVECQCCINCGSYPCKCECVIPNPCDCCCQMCGNFICEECLSNPCICCPLCHENKCGVKNCEHEQEFLKNSIDNIKCPLHNAHSMKHNPGCPFEVKCPHEPKCSHKGSMNNSTGNNSSYNNSPNNINNRTNSMFNNSQNRNKAFCPHNSNISQNSNYNSFNQRKNNNISYNNNFQNNNEENNGPYDDNNQNYPNNNIQYNEGNEEENDNNMYNNSNKKGPLSPLSSPFPPDSPYFNINEPGNKSNWIFCPKCNVYHRCPHPGCDHSPDKRTTTHQCIHENEENQNPNMNPNNNPINNNINNNSSNNQNSMATPNFNNNSRQNIVFPKNNSISFNPNNNINNSNNINNNINMSQSNKSVSSKKRGVFSSCPYQEELGQFVDFLGLLMEVESKIEDMKIDLARKPDFNFEDIFRIFEADGKGYIEPEDLKQGLRLLGLNPTDFDIKLLMKRFDLNQQNLLSYTDFFDMVVSFEKKTRNSVQIRPPNSCCPCKSPDIFECDTLIAIKNLFKFIIECEREINQVRAGFDSLRSKYSEVVKFLDYSKRGVINRSDLKLYLTQFNKFTTSKECDLLFIRLDRTRAGEVGINEIENELMFLR